MPFTLSHPLAVVPLKRTGLVFSALVVGSISPDCENFLRPFNRILPLSLDSHFSHTFAGMFVVCLPVGLLMLWLWHELLKRPLIELTPESHRLRLEAFAAEFSFGPARRFACVCLSILAGAATHIIWDSFTHPWGWPVQNVALLHAEIPLPGLAPLRAFRCLQHLSTVLGLLALLLLYWHWFRHAPPARKVPAGIPPARRALFVLTGAAIALSSGLAFAWHRFPLSDPENFRGFVVRTVVVAMGITLTQSVLFALWYLRRATRP